MSRTILIEAAPLLGSGTSYAAVRLAGGGSRAFLHKGFTDWRDGVAISPKFSTSLGFDASGWTGGAIPTTTTVLFSPADGELLTQLSNLYWPGARLYISADDDEKPAPTWPVIMAGTVAEAKVSAGTLALAIADMSGDLNKVALPDNFAGTGGLEGDASAAGRIKRRTWGRVFNVEGRVLEGVNNIYEFGDPRRPLYGFPDVRDKGASAQSLTLVPWQGSADATLNALRASAPPAQGAAIAPSIACVKWFTQPTGPLTADIQGEAGAGYVEDPSNVAARILGTYSLIPFVNASEVANWRSAAVGIHVDEAGETVANLLDRLFLPISLLWVMQPNGALVVRRWEWTPFVEVLESDSVTRDAVYPPLKSRRVGYQRNHRIHSDSEISALISGGDVTYVDGTPIEVLKPEEAKSNRTETRVAAAFTGQSEWATDPTPVSYMKATAPNLVFDGALRFRGFGFLNDDGWGWYPGGAGEGPFLQIGISGTRVVRTPTFLVTGNQYVTAQADLFAGGISAGGLVMDIIWIDGNGNVSPSNRVTALNGTSWTFYSVTALSPPGTVRAYIRVFIEGATNNNAAVRRIKGATAGGATLFTDDASNTALYATGQTIDTLRPAAFGADPTAQNTAAAIAGQGALATKGSVNLASGEVQNRYAEYLVYGFNGIAMSDLRPAEAGGNVTEARSAASIYGQGTLATRNAAGLGTTIVRADGSTIVFDADAITALGSAAAIYGQGRFATINYVGDGDFTYGAIAGGSEYYRQDFNDNSQTQFVSMMGIAYTSKQGGPIDGAFNFRIRRIGGTGACYIKATRYPDGTAVWGGANGLRINPTADGESISHTFLDSIPAGAFAQYSIDIRCDPGTNMREDMRRLTILEKKRPMYDQLYIAVAPGEGPGAGPGGGGNVNGDTSGAGGASTYPGAGSNYQGGGLRQAAKEIS